MSNKNNTINWKKEGFLVGEDVLIINVIGFYDTKKEFITGKVIYVGTKRLKVSIQELDKEKILDFNGKRSVNGCLFGNYYLVYKSKEEYEAIVAIEEETSKLIEHINSNIKNLSLSKLRKISKIIDSN